MKITCISDTHTQLKDVSLPPADILVITGDATYRGDFREIADFSAALGKIIKKKLFRQIIFVSGNHDFMFQDNRMAAVGLLPKGVIYLQDSSFTFEGIKFYGSPWQPWFRDWAFNFPEHDARRDFIFASRMWNEIPLDTNVLLTHTPPFGILDKCERDGRLGCPSLRKRLGELTDTGNLKLHVFGHIHEGYGQQIMDGVLYVNASTCNEKYKPVNPPIVVEVNI